MQVSVHVCNMKECMCTWCVCVVVPWGGAGGITGAQWVQRFQQLLPL